MTTLLMPCPSCRDTHPYVYEQGNPMRLYCTKCGQHYDMPVHDPSATPLRLRLPIAGGGNIEIGSTDPFAGPGADYFSVEDAAGFQRGYLELADAQHDAALLRSRLYTLFEQASNMAAVAAQDPS